MTDWPAVIFTLRGRGMTIREIAIRCGVHHSTISRLQAGEFHQPSYAIGVRLLALVADSHHEADV